MHVAGSDVLNTPRTPATILVTGGAGFIGSAFIRAGFAAGFAGRIINLDALTYAGNPHNLDGAVDQNRYEFVHGDIRDQALMEQLLASKQVDAIVHFAAESHVDRSIHGPKTFLETNIMGTFALLEAVRARAAAGQQVHVHHVSTDEVFGSLPETGFFVEETRYDPRSPYSASKAASDHLVRAYAHTYGLSTTMSNCSNNYGPYHFPEKLIPLMILNCMNGKPLPVYGDGQNVRDWLYVEDHAMALWTVLQRGGAGSTWNVGGRNEWKNLDLVHLLCDVVGDITGKPNLRSLIKFVPDRPGHDRRYAIDCSKIETQLHWKPAHDFPSGLRKTVQWYVDHPQWVEQVQSGAYREWLTQNYQAR
jgi:dTDP-glucose 4,6-dehydratase